MQFLELTIMASMPVLASALFPAAMFPDYHLDKRTDSWGPAVGLGPAKAEIVKAVTTTYPGEMPSNQAGGLFLWPGMSNGTGNLIQSVIGSYSAGASECSGSNADNEWCISSEVYGDITPGVPNQWVGTLTTLDPTPDTGLTFTYTLVDNATYLWNQTVHDATSGKLMSTFETTSGPMLGWGTAVECQSCTPTISEQTYINTVITLKSADLTFPDTLGSVFRCNKYRYDNQRWWYYLDYREDYHSSHELVIVDIL